MYVYTHIYIHTYIYIYISINGRSINCKYIIATNSFMCAITKFRLYSNTIWKKTVLCYTYMIDNKV